MTREELVEKVALDIRNASCLTPTYPFKVFDPNEAEANIREWCRYAAQAAIDVVLEEAAKAGVAAVNECRESGECDLRAVREGVNYAIRALGED
jgi:hypothetical protein